MLVTRYRLVNRTVFTDGTSGPVEWALPFGNRRAARSELARLLWDLRHHLDVIAIRDAPEDYYLTNVQGPTRFDRRLYIESELVIEPRRGSRS